MEYNNKSFQFVKYHTCLAYMFEPAEIVFIMRMMELEFMKLNGYKVEWTRAEYMKHMGLTTYSFDKCIKSLCDLKLLSKKNNNLGNRVYYSFDGTLYNRLLTILHATRNADVLISFCNINFKQNSRTISSITDEEIVTLRNTKKYKYNR